MDIELNDLPLEVLLHIALQMDLPELLNFCKSSKEINDKTCRNNLFWIKKLKRDFDLSYLESEAPRKIYLDKVREIIEDYKNLIKMGETFRNLSKHQRLLTPSGFKITRKT